MTCDDLEKHASQLRMLIGQTVYYTKTPPPGYEPGDAEQFTNRMSSLVDEMMFDIRDCQRIYRSKIVG